MEARFREFARPIKQRLEARIDRYLELGLDAGAIPTGTDWAPIRSAIEAQVLAALPTLSEDHSAPTAAVVVGITITGSTSPNDGTGEVVLMQIAPPELERQRAVALETSILDKRPVLESYKAHGYRTILLLERRHLALSDRATILAAFRHAADRCGSGIDDVYLVEMHAGPPAVSPLKIGSALADRCRPAWPTAPGYAATRVRP